MNGDTPQARHLLSTGSAPGSVSRILRNSTINLAALGISAVFNLVAVFTLARRLGKDVLGQYYLVFALVAAVQLVLEAGLSTVVTLRIAQAPDKWRKIVSETLGLMVLVSLASAAVVLGIGLGWAGVQSDWTLLMLFVAAAAACAAMQVQFFLAGIFRAFERLEYESLAKILQSAFFTVFVVLMVRGDPSGLQTALTGFAASHGLAAVSLVGGLWWGWRFLGVRLDLATVKDWLSTAVPLGVGDVIRRLTLQLDTLLLGVLRPAAAVGIYSIAYRPLGPLNWIPRAVLSATFPMIARMAENGRDRISSAFARTTRLLWVVSLPFAIGICVCAEPALEALAGAEYLEAAAPMRVLIWITCLSFLSAQFRFLFAALGTQQVYTRLSTAMFVLKLALGTVLIWRWGYMGACGVSLCTEVLFLGAGLAVCRNLGVSGIEWQSLTRAALAGAVMGAGLWTVRDASLPVLILAAGIATGIYFGLCIVFRVLPWVEVGHIYGAFTRLFWRPVARPSAETPTAAECGAAPRSSR